MKNQTQSTHIHFETGLLLVTLLLLGLGAVMVYSATVYGVNAAAVRQETQGEGAFYLYRHAFMLGLGLVAMLVGALIPPRVYERLAGLFMIIGIILMVLVLFLGEEQLGATRWFSIYGKSFQPGELAKLVFVMWLSYSLSQKGDRLESFKMGVLPHLLAAAVLVGLFLAQPDGGSSIILIAIMTAMLFVAGTRMRHIFGLAALATPMFAVIIFFSDNNERWNRIKAWLNPEAYRNGDGYQLTQSKISIGSGGLIGPGPGSGAQNISGYVPEAETDFIFSVIAEELGFLGSVAVIAAFAYILYRGFRMARDFENPFARYMSFGVTLLIVLQGAINIGVSTGVLPTKGLTLPFVSMGGSSLLVLCGAMGILLGLSATQRRTGYSTVSRSEGITASDVVVKEGA